VLDTPAYPRHGKYVNKVEGLGSAPSALHLSAVLRYDSPKRPSLYSLKSGKHMRVGHNPERLALGVAQPPCVMEPDHYSRQLMEAVSSITHEILQHVADE
jgi:hypothetical protein